MQNLNTISQFEFNNQTVRYTIDNEGKAWLVLNDVCRAVGLSARQEVYKRIPQEHAKLVIIETRFGSQKFNSANLEGLKKAFQYSIKESIPAFMVACESQFGVVDHNARKASAEKSLSYTKTKLHENSAQRFSLETLIDEEGTAWLSLQDVCYHLGIVNVRDAKHSLKETYTRVVIADRDKGVISRSVTLVNESGFYLLALRGRKPSAIRFRDWVVEDVLPSIRKHGFYSLNAQLQTYIGKYAQLKPKAEYYDHYRSLKGGHGLQATAKILGLRPNLFIQRLVKDGLLHRRDKCLTPNEVFTKKKWFTTRLFELQGTRVPGHQTMVTPTGVQELAKLYQSVPELLSFQYRPSANDDSLIESNVLNDNLDDSFDEESLNDDFFEDTGIYHA